MVAVSQCRLCKIGRTRDKLRQHGVGAKPVKLLRSWGFGVQRYMSYRVLHGKCGKHRSLHLQQMQPSSSQDKARHTRGTPKFGKLCVFEYIGVPKGAGSNFTAFWFFTAFLEYWCALGKTYENGVFHHLHRLTARLSISPSQGQAHQVSVPSSCLFLEFGCALRTWYNNFSSDQEK